MGVGLSGAGQRLVKWIETWEKNNVAFCKQASDVKKFNKFAYDFEQQALKEYTFSTKGNVVAYSGWVGNNPMWQIVSGICENGDGKYTFINYVDAHELLDGNDTLVDAINELFGENSYRELLNGTNGKYVTSITGKDAAISLNDFVSENLMKNTKTKDVLALVDANTIADGVFARSELKQLLNNGVTETINELKVDDLKRYLNGFLDAGMTESEAYGNVAKIIASRTDSMFSKIKAVSSNGIIIDEPRKNVKAEREIFIFSFIFIKFMLNKNSYKFIIKK